MVPSWITAVKAAPGSSHPKNAGTMRRCPLLEIGRNSVRPWTMPRTIACSASMQRRNLSDGAQLGLAAVEGERAEPAEMHVIGPVEVGRAGAQEPELGAAARHEPGLVL